MELYRNSFFFLTFLFPPFHDLFLSLGSLKNFGLMDIVPFGKKARKGKIHITDFILSPGGKQGMNAGARRMDGA